MDCAIKTCNHEMIEYIYYIAGKINNPFNYINVDIAFMTEHKMYYEFHKLTLYMIKAAEYDVDKIIITKLNQCKAQITDEVIISMINSTIDFINFKYDLCNKYQMKFI